MSHSEIECENVENRDISTLYACVNMDNKSNRKKNKLEKRASNKYEFIIPVENSEFSTSDSNIYELTHVSEESLLSSRSMFGSADNIISDKPIQNGTNSESSLYPNNTDTLRKIRLPPPAIPPPYQIRGDYEAISQPQTEDASPFRRSKSINSKPQLTANQKMELNNKFEINRNGFDANPRRIVPQSFRFHRDDKPRPVPGITKSLPTKNVIKPPQIPNPFVSQNSSPIPMLPQRKPSPPENANNNKNPSPTLNNNNNIESAPLETNNSPPPLPKAKPQKPLPTVPTKPVLKPPILSNPPTLKSGSAVLRKQVPLSPPPSKNFKHPARLPPPPPAHSLTLPRKRPSPPKSPSIGDYTVLTPMSPDTSPVDFPAFSPLSNTSDYSPNEPQALITDEGYSILNVDEIQCDDTTSETKPIEKPSQLTLFTKEQEPLRFTRTGSLPLTRHKPANISPPKKPPRLLNSITTPLTDNNNSDYAILSSLDSSALSQNGRHSMSGKEHCTVSSPVTSNIKTMTLPNKAARIIPPKPQAYRNRSQSHNMQSSLCTTINSNDYTSSVEVKCDSKKNGSTTEGNIFSKVFQKSKKIRGKDHNESTVSPTISNPILGSHNATKVVGLNSVLVSECIAYLKQSKSLREEGLFRIPGDLNQVKMYHKLFDFSMSTDLNEELDPNTISSVLKQHIRDNGGLLPKREAGDLYAAVRQKNIEEIRTVINRIPAEQQDILNQILHLFKEVCEHTEDNKMCTGALATSCGLSIFPTVNAGNANLMLKNLIDNVDQIFD